MPLVRDGQILSSALFSELVLVETGRANGDGSRVVGLAGMRTECFRLSPSARMTWRDSR